MQIKIVLAVATLIAPATVATPTLSLRTQTQTYAIQQRQCAPMYMTRMSAPPARLDKRKVP